MIKEIIVVEGKDDIARVKAAVEADVIACNGTHISPGFLKKIKMLGKSREIIILTDPDWAGKKIRKTLTKAVPNAKQAYVRRDLSTKNGDIGVENASNEEIRRALLEAKTLTREGSDRFSKMDLYELGLSGGSDSKILRKKLSDKLGVDYMNGGALLDFLNSLDMDRETLENLLREIEDNE